MNEQRDQLIDQLSRQLTPTPAPVHSGRRAAAWLTIGALLTLTGLLLSTPLRPGWASQLLAEPLYALEALLGLLTLGCAAALTFNLGIPAHPARRLLYPATLGLLSAWMLLLIGHWLLGPGPAAGPMAGGERRYCELEILVLALLPLTTGALSLRRLVFEAPLRQGALLGLAAGLLPAWLMLTACGPDPRHTLLYHLSPVVLVVLLGSLVLHWLATRRRA